MKPFFFQLKGLKRLWALLLFKISPNGRRIIILQFICCASALSDTNTALKVGSEPEELEFLPAASWKEEAQISHYPSEPGEFQTSGTIRASSASTEASLDGGLSLISWFLDSTTRISPSSRISPSEIESMFPNQHLFSWPALTMNFLWLWVILVPWTWSQTLQPSCLKSLGCLQFKVQPLNN